MRTGVLLVVPIFILALWIAGCESEKMGSQPEEEEKAEEQQEMTAAPEEAAPAGEEAEEAMEEPAEGMEEAAEEMAGEATEESGEMMEEAETAMAPPQPLDAPGDSPGNSANGEGIAHYKEGHWDIAEKHFRKAVEADPKLAQAHYNLALTLDKQGKHGDATQHFKEALDLAPDNPDISESQILKDHVGM